MIERKAAVAAILIAMAGPAAAQSGWSDIGHGSVSGDSGTATIAAHGDPRYRELMLCTDGHEVRINAATIHFADNHTQTINIRARIAAGACSRMFSLSAHGQGVASADIAYDPASLAGGTAQVQLFAR